MSSIKFGPRIEYGSRSSFDILVAANDVSMCRERDATYINLSGRVKDFGAQKMRSN